MSDLDQIPHQESYLVEFKDFSGGVSVKELAISFSAMANTEGGTVYLGVTDKGEVKGLKLTTELLDKVQNAAREVCVPSVVIKLSQIPVSKQKKLLLIKVEKSTHLHSVSSGATYIRVGSQDKKILGEELLRLAESKSQVSFEESPLPAGIEAIDRESLDEYTKARINRSNLRKNLSQEELLIKLGLAIKEKGKLRLKAAAFILFGKASESLLLQRDFSFVRYESEEGFYTYREDLSLPAARLIDRLLELLEPYIHFTKDPQRLRRQEELLYPLAALREALVNAVAHRDYRLAGLKNECRLYPDRLEIISAGSLPAMISLENLSERHYSRNPKITQALLTLGFMEELGQGIGLMQSSLKANGNPPPEFIESVDQFKVIFKKKKSPLSESQSFKILEKALASQGALSRRQIEELLGLKSTSVKLKLKTWLARGLIKRLGSGPATQYELKKN